MEFNFLGRDILDSSWAYMKPRAYHSFAAHLIWFRFWNVLLDCKAVLSTQIYGY